MCGFQPLKGNAVGLAGIPGTKLRPCHLWLIDSGFLGFSGHAFVRFPSSRRFARRLFFFAGGRLFRFGGGFRRGAASGKRLGRSQPPRRPPCPSSRPPAWARLLPALLLRGPRRPGELGAGRKPPGDGHAERSRPGEFDFSAWPKKPDLIKMTLSGNQRELVLAYDGDTAWKSLSGSTAVREADGWRGRPPLHPQLPFRQITCSTLFEEGKTIRYLDTVPSRRQHLPQIRVELEYGLPGRLLLSTSAATSNSGWSTRTSARNWSAATYKDYTRESACRSPSTSAPRKNGEWVSTLTLDEVKGEPRPDALDVRHAGDRRRLVAPLAARQGLADGAQDWENGGRTLLSACGGAAKIGGRYTPCPPAAERQKSERGHSCPPAAARRSRRAGQSRRGAGGEPPPFLAAVRTSMLGVGCWDV